MLKKIIIIVAAIDIVIIIAGVIYFAITAPKAQQTAQQTVYSTKEECEGNSGKGCIFLACDYAPPGKTLKEVCDKDFKKGWVPIGDGLD